MLRDLDTGFLVLETPIEKDAVRMVLGLPGWSVIKAAFQNHAQTMRDTLTEPSLLRGVYTDVESGRILGFLQGQATAFDVVLRNVLEQLAERPPDPEAGQDTTEGDSLGIEPDPAELKGLKDHGTGI